MTVQWAEPPPIGGPQDPRSVYMERMRLIRERPGEWALIRSGSPSAMHQTAGKLRQRQYHIPPGQWEFRVRTFRRGVHVGDMNVANLYCRYLGEEEIVPYQQSPHGVIGENGQRVCPDCGADLVRRNKRGKYPLLCDECWAKVGGKWARMRIRRVGKRFQPGYWKNARPRWPHCEKCKDSGVIDGAYCMDCPRGVDWLKRVADGSVDPAHLGLVDGNAD